MIIVVVVVVVVGVGVVVVVKLNKKQIKIEIFNQHWRLDTMLHSGCHCPTIFSRSLVTQDNRKYIDLTFHILVL